MKNKIIILLLILFNVVFHIAVQPIKVSGTSMFPTYEDNQYGFSLKFKPALKTIKRFDVVVVHSEITKSEYWIKRVIGFPGETIEYKEDRLYVNGELVKEDFLDEEYVNNYKLDYQTTFTDDFKMALNKNEYLLLGDNRPKSNDSRFVGPFHKENIISKYIVVIG